MESNETLPEGFVQMVDCCKFCIHSNTGEHLQLLGQYSRHDICVIIFSTCKDYTQTNKSTTILSNTKPLTLKRK